MSSMNSPRLSSAMFVPRRFFQVASVALTAALAILGARAQSPAGQAPTTPKLAEEQFKNIKVLNGIPAEQVIPAMQFITASLGVECEYCHVRQEKGMAFDKDDKTTLRASARSPASLAIAAPPNPLARPSSQPKS
jgi:hypothetical protein